MLNALRKKKVAKRILWVLALLIIPAFIFWGVGNVGKKRISGYTYVGIVNGRKINIDDFFKAKRGVEMQILLNYFAQREIMDKFLKDRELVNRLAWDRIIMMEEAKRENINVKDKEVVGFVTSHPLFVNKGVFDEKFYNYMLQQQLGISARAFEEEIRHSLKITKLRDNILKGVTVTEEEALALYQEEFEKGIIHYIEIEEPDEMLAVIQKENLSLEEASSRFNLKLIKSGPVSRFDYLEGVGEAYAILDGLIKDSSRKIKKFETRKGYILAHLYKFQDIDKEKFEKEKENYRNKALAIKKQKALESWLTEISKETKLVVDLSLL